MSTTIDDAENDEEESDDESEEENEASEVERKSNGKEEQEDDEDEDDDEDDDDDEDEPEVDGNKIIRLNGTEEGNKIIAIDLTSSASSLHNMSTNASQSGKKTTTKKRKLGGMLGSIQEMMYGFGDTHVFPPNEKSVTLLQNLVTNYIDDLSCRAAEVAELRNKDGLGKLDKECFVFLVRKDRAKFQRVYKLLKASEELKTVQKLEIREDQPI
mmetsp:Transcript_22177/g.30407  ORF Transcript_22177/g.30407 Transcript_22177/m.30407 type:complete len:213 (+) Transcript_22177:1-639(+)